MGRETNKLEALRLKRGLPEGRHWDGEGLYLEVVSATAMYWRYKYRFAGKEKRIGLGVYPTVSLAEARECRTAVKAQVSKGIDPSAARKAEKSQAKIETDGTFAAVAEAWYLDKSLTWADSTKRKARFVLDEYLLPKFRNESMATLVTSQVAPFLCSMGKSVPDLARKARQYLNDIVMCSLPSPARKPRTFTATRSAKHFVRWDFGESTRPTASAACCGPPLESAFKSIPMCWRRN
ncbi:MAG: tyrosine-type recombinase/integrase [Panacagrimonas sp.]